MKTLIRFLLKYLPFKKQFFTVVKNLFKPSEAIYKHLHFTGDIIIKVDENKSFKIHHYGFQLENELFWSGLQNGWEKESINLWTKLSLSSSTIFDIGANTGVFSLISGAVNPNAKIHAFEPVQRVFEKLEHNVQLNNFNVETNQIALSNKKGKAIIYDQPTEHIYSVTVNADLSTKDANTFEVEIETNTLKKYIESNRINSIDLMKIDVETHEPEVLEGFGELLLEYKPSILIEILNDEIGERVQRFFDNSDYIFFNIDEELGVSQCENLKKSTHFNYLICTKTIATKLNII